MGIAWRRVRRGGPLSCLAVSGLAVVLAVSGCSRSPNTSDAQEAGFTPDPQPLEERPVATLAIGDPAPDFRLPGVDGRYWRLSDFDAADALVVLFTCNHCPTAQAYEERVERLEREYRDRGVALVAISSTSPLGLLPEECGYTDLDDDYEAMRLRAEHRGFEFPYLYDGDLQEAAIAYGPTATPHAFLFDRERRLRYAGRLDDKENPSKGGDSEDLRAALDAVLDGRDPETAVTKTFGCSIKWAWKRDYREKVDREWAERPVEVDRVDPEGVAELLANEGDSLRLINVWATTCGPCVMELPDFVTIQRYYGDRSFEVVLLSADPLERIDAVRALLEKKRAPLRNLIWAGEDPYALVEAVDPQWQGALPFTLLLAPGGEVVYRREGAIDPLELRRVIVEHERMGRFF